MPTAGMQEPHSRGDNNSKDARNASSKVDINNSMDHGNSIDFSHNTYTWMLMYADTPAPDGSLMQYKENLGYYYEYK
jgi:hypothetical protein